MGNNTNRPGPGCGGARPPSEWQPIASAPKDGTWILLRGESGYIGRPYRVHVGRWDSEYRPHSPWQTSETDSFLDDGGPPTHWSELLPDPPKGGA